MIYALLLIAAGVWVCFYGGPFPYTCFFSLLFYPPLSAACLLICNASLRFSIATDLSMVTKGDAAHVKITLMNAGPVYCCDFMLQKEALVSRLDGIEDTVPLSLAPGERLELDGDLHCFYAGVYETGIQAVLWKDPFGLYQIAFRILSPLRIQVRPRVTDIADALLNLENRKNNALLFSPSRKELIPGNDMRLYRAGDSVRHINWKVSAVRDDLYTRLPDPQDIFPVIVFLDVAADGLLLQKDPDAIRRRDRMLEFTVSAVSWFFENGWAVCVYLPRGGMEEHSIQSPAAFDAFCDLLSGPIFASQAGKRDMDAAAEASSAMADTMTAIIHEEAMLSDNFCEIFFGGHTLM